MNQFQPDPDGPELCEIMHAGTVTEAYAPLHLPNPEASALRALAEYLSEQPERVPVIAISTFYRDTPHQMFVAVMITAPPVSSIEDDLYPNGRCGVCGWGLNPDGTHPQDPNNDCPIR